MAAPVDAARATTDGSTSTTSQALNLPGGISSGDKLLAVLRFPTNPTSVSVAGFTAITALRGVDASDDSQIMFERTADGTEGATVTVTLGTAARMAGLVYLITGGDTIEVNDSAMTSGTSASPNSPNYAPFGGSAAVDQHDVLWLTVGGIESALTITTAPTSYSNATIIANTGDTGNGQCSVYGASRQVTADLAEDPGAWTLSASDDWMAWTVAVYQAIPAAIVTHIPAEVLISPTDARARVSQIPAEIVISPTSSRARVSQLVVEAVVENIVITDQPSLQAIIFN